MLLAAAMILLGFIALKWSADIFMSGAASMENNAGMSPVITGLTPVAVGTGLPELAASVTRAMRGHTESAPGHACLGRTLVTLFVSSHALYYYSLQSAL
jgi:cation:H+ antiporter